MKLSTILGNVAALVSGAAMAGGIIALLLTSDARGGDCDSIHDTDRRFFCRAVTSGHVEWCSYITAPDLRAECRAVVKNQRKTR